MHINYKSNITANCFWQGFSAVCFLSLFLIVTVTFAQTPRLRANGKIAFTSNRDGNREIYAMNPDGTNQTRLTDNNIIDDHPAWSPDGRKIAFISQRATGQYAIFQMNADGTGKTEITPVNYQPGSGYANGWTIGWSPDGSQLVFTDVQGNAAFISIVKDDGSSRRVLTSGYGPAWSPDGSKVLFIRGAFPWVLHTINPDGTDLRTLPPLPNYYPWYYDAAWSPAGSQIVITAFDGANEGIFISNADGTNAREFHFQCAEFSRGCSRLAAASWSPDARTIVFFVWGSQSDSEIYVKDIAGGEARRLTNTTGTNSNPSWQSLDRSSTLADFDGDGRADISVFRPSDRTWYLNQSTNGLSATQFGLSTDKITPADYDGDGKTDVAVYRNGTWYLQRSQLGFTGITFGAGNDIPQPADYDGDGKSEIAVYRPSTGTWYIYNLMTNQTSGAAFGTSEDKPVAADYDGDGKADIAVFRSSSGTWYLQRSSLGFTGIAFGQAEDKPVPADYDGDGKDDVAVFRPSNGTWYLQRSQLGFTGIGFGLETDLPVPADYDGDGKSDVAVFRNGTWYLQRSQAGFTGVAFGAATDKPVPNAYVP